MAPGPVPGTYKSEINAANNYNISVIKHAIKELIAITNAGTLYV